MLKLRNTIGAVVLLASVGCGSMQSAHRSPDGLVRTVPSPGTSSPEAQARHAVVVPEAWSPEGRARDVASVPEAWSPEGRARDVASVPEAWSPEGRASYS